MGDATVTGGRREMRRALVSALILALLPAGCSTRSERLPNIILIVLDTVRRDHLSTYGYARETSPRLDAFRKDARIYTRAYSTSGLTVPSHASIFTGLYAARHGATQERDELGDGFETLAEIVRSSGYQTVGAIGNPMIGSRRGFDRGFEIYRESWRARAPESHDLSSFEWIDRFLDERDDDRPLFLFVNLIGPHTPFDSCQSHCGMFGAEIIEGGLNDVDWKQYYQGKLEYSKEDLDRLVRLYDAEVRQVDTILGRILDTTADHLAKESDFVAVTSDHGENIGEHGHVNHVFSVHETTIQIPMIIRYPAQIEAGSEDDRGAQLLDLFPTILQVAGIERNEDRHHGLDLFRSWEDPRPIFSEYYRPEQAIGKIYKTANRTVKKRLKPFRRRVRSVIESDWKFIWGSDGRHELYDLSEDPNELENLIDRPGSAPRAKSLQAKLTGLIVRYSAGPERATTSQKRNAPPPLDAESEAALRKLGYID